MTDTKLHFLKSYLETLPETVLPGLDAQLLMAPSFRDEELKKKPVNGTQRQSAVLILLYPDSGETKTLMMKRSSKLHHHAGQISFPGGQIDPEDQTSWDTAIRETEEETGIDRNSISQLARLSDLYIPPSNFNVQVYVGYIKQLPELYPNLDEVDELLKIPVRHFLDSSSIQPFTFELRKGDTREAPAYVWQDHIIWGASAMMMSELIEVIKKMPAE